MRWEHVMLLRLFLSTVGLVSMVHVTMALIGHFIAAVLLGIAAFMCADMAVVSALEQRQ